MTVFTYVKRFETDLFKWPRTQCNEIEFREQKSYVPTALFQWVARRILAFSFHGLRMVYTEY
jgi:hypothetical protein